MKHRSTNSARFALTGVALAAACLWGSSAWALGLGRLSVQSALGETLRAEIDITSITAEEASTLRLRVAPPEAYRAAGVDYNPALPSARIQILRRPDGRDVVRITSDRAILEPFVDVILEATWSSGRLVREYTLLFDPPSARIAQAPAPATPAAISPAPQAPAPAPAPVPAPAPAPLAAAPAPRAPVAEPPAPRPPAAAPAPRAAAPARAAGPEAGADEVRVRPGDTLTRIAGRTQHAGVSLDQMLVSLFRANPQAFMGENMNRLKSGSVLSVPSAADAGATPSPQAREIILAQSADFDAYRQGLASGTTTTTAGAPTRQARGQVQAQVEDKRQGAAAAPDKLQLSQGGLTAGDGSVSRDTERKDSGARLAELARNVEELKQLQQGVPTAPAGPAAAPAPAPAAAPTPGVAPAVVAQAPAVPPVVTPPAPASAAAPAPAAVPKPLPKPAEEPGFMASLLDNPLLLPGAGVLVALLAGIGLWRVRGGRGKKQEGETSFLESRLQPDSFFGASGGQRIDTRDAAPSTSSTTSSSMSYSLSQLDAIGDVDPVAEADVYLAYGRDLQAEEILKEAMRASPERMAVRLKLLEVYAKRRDTKGFELLATQVFNLTGGQGEDWPKAQALGLSIDPDNTLYQPGAQPDAVIGAGGQPVEALSASTMPYTAPVERPAFVPASDATLSGGMDLDLDLGSAAAATPPAYEPDPLPLPDMPPPDPEATQAFGTAASLSGGNDLDFDLGAVEQPLVDDSGDATISLPAPAPSAAAGGLDFDLGDIAFDSPAPPPPAALPDLADFPLDAGDGGLPADGDPLARKLELAEEFRQIGDLEGARDLLEEVVAKADGALRNKAQGMLDALG